MFSQKQPLLRWNFSLKTPTKCLCADALYEFQIGHQQNNNVSNDREKKEIMHRKCIDKIWYYLFMQQAASSIDSDSNNVTASDVWLHVYMHATEIRLAE